MTRVNVNILGIRELTWTGWVNLTQMTIISTTVGKNPSVVDITVIMVNKRV